MERLVKLSGECEDVWIPISRLTGQPLHDGAFHLRTEVQVGARLVEGDWGLREELGEHLPRALGEVWEGTCQEEIRNGREGVLVGSWSDELAGKGLWGNVHEGADEIAGPGEAFVLTGVGRGCNAKVEELGGACRGIVHRVVGF